MGQYQEKGQMLADEDRETHMPGMKQSPTDEAWS